MSRSWVASSISPGSHRSLLLVDGLVGFVAPTSVPGSLPAEDAGWRNQLSMAMDIESCDKTPQDTITHKTCLGSRRRLQLAGGWPDTPTEAHHESLRVRDRGKGQGVGASRRIVGRRRA